MVLFLLSGNTSTYGQCLNYQVYESFNGTSLPTSGGTWAQTSITFGTTLPRTGNNSIVFNAANDAIRTPLITNPGIFHFGIEETIIQLHIHLPFKPLQMGLLGPQEAQPQLQLTFTNNILLI